MDSGITIALYLNRLCASILSKQGEGWSDEKIKEYLKSLCVEIDSHENIIDYIKSSHDKGQE